MRMWMLPTNLLCRKHLLGEHGELHKHLPSLRKGHNIKGRFFPIVQVELSSYLKRHDDIAQEMLDRNYNHKSPLTDIPDFQKIYPAWFDLQVDLEYNLIDLYLRCPDCAKRIDNENLHR